jgi:hypothetical protein
MPPIEIYEKRGALEIFNGVLTEAVRLDIAKLNKFLSTALAKKRGKKKAGEVYLDKKSGYMVKMYEDDLRTREQNLVKMSTCGVITLVLIFTHYFFLLFSVLANSIVFVVLMIKIADSVMKQILWATQTAFPSLIMFIFWIAKKNIMYPYGEPPGLNEWQTLHDNIMMERDRIELENFQRKERWELWVLEQEDKRIERERNARNKEDRIKKNINIIGYLMRQKFMPEDEAPPENVEHIKEIAAQGLADKSMQEAVWEDLDRNDRTSDARGGNPRKYKVHSDAYTRSYHKPAYVAPFTPVKMAGGRKINRVAPSYQPETIINEEPEKGRGDEYSQDGKASMNAKQIVRLRPREDASNPMMTGMTGLGGVSRLGTVGLNSLNDPMAGDMNQSSGRRLNNENLAPSLTQIQSESP